MITISDFEDIEGFEDIREELEQYTPEQLEMIMEMYQAQQKTAKLNSWNEEGEEEEDNKPSEDELASQKKKVDKRVESQRSLQERRETALREAIKRIESSTGEIQWSNPDKNGEIINGYLEERHLFEIKRGLSLYSMKVIDPELKEIYRKKSGFLSHSSPEYKKLKDKAVKIVKNYINE